MFGTHYGKTQRVRKNLLLFGFSVYLFFFSISFIKVEKYIKKSILEIYFCSLFTKRWCSRHKPGALLGCFCSCCKKLWEVVKKNIKAKDFFITNNQKNKKKLILINEKEEKNVNSRSHKIKLLVFLVHLCGVNEKNCKRRKKIIVGIWWKI